jgi:hypothetical protein
MDKWEYLTGSSCVGGVEIDAYPRKKEYCWNDLGQQGWELAGTFSSGHVIFKRRIPESPAQTLSTEKRKTVDHEISF